MGVWVCVGWVCVCVCVCVLLPPMFRSVFFRLENLNPAKKANIYYFAKQLKLSFQLFQIKNKYTRIIDKNGAFFPQ